MQTTEARTPRAYGAVEERVQRGQRAAQEHPLDAWATWEVRPGRTRAVDLIEEQSRDRVPELVPLRYARMAASPFAFFRGAAIAQAADLAQMEVSGLEVQCVGDAHIANFGLFLSPTRHLVFDINDFDETAPGPWEWDVARLVASVEICARGRDFDRGDRRHAVRACLKEYRRALRQFSQMGELDIWYAHLDVDRALDELEDELGGKQGRTIRRAVERARSKDSVRAADKLSERVDGRLRFRSDPPELVPLTQLADTQGYGSSAELLLALTSLFDTYVRSLAPDRRALIDRYHLEDVARKVVGVGSVGTRAWVGLLTGRDADDPLVMQVKEAGVSVVERFWRPTGFMAHGERVVTGQRLIQSTSDILLGWASTPTAAGTTRDYYVRQLWNGKGSIDLDEVGPESLTYTAQLCARALAHAHARTGDVVAIASYLEDKDAFEDAFGAYACAYADQNEADYAVFCARHAAEGSAGTTAPEHEEARA